MKTLSFSNRDHNKERDVFKELAHLRATSNPDYYRLRNQLAEHYRGLAQKIARRFIHSGEPIEDLLQEAYLGLIKAVEQFNPERGVLFSTFATYNISGEIQHYLRDCSQRIREAGWHQELRFKIFKTREELEQVLSGVVTVQDIANHIDEPCERIEAALRTGFMLEIDSLADLQHDDGGEDSPKLEFTDGTDGWVDSIADQIVVEQALERLKRNQRTAITLYFYRELSKADIARELGISVNYVAYLVRSGLRKLKKIFEEEGIEPSRS